MLNVHIIYCDDSDGSSLIALVEEAGHRVVSYYRLSSDELNDLSGTKADVVVLDAAASLQLRQEGSPIDLSDCLVELLCGLGAPAVLIAPASDVAKSVGQRGRSTGLLYACLTAPVRPSDLNFAVDLAFARHNDVAALRAKKRR